MSSILAAWPAGAQSTATVIVKSRMDAGTAVVRECSVAVHDTVPEGIHTNTVHVQFLHEIPVVGTTDTDTILKAPFAMRVAVGSQDAVSIATNADSARLNLVHAPLRGSEIRVSKPAEAGSLCAVKVEEEDEPVEIDPAFQLLAGVEFISLDGFQERVAHIPATARWIIPIYVKAADPWDTTGTWWTRKRRHWHRNPYALLTTSAEYTRVVAEEQNFICAGTTIPDTANPGSVSGTQCSANQAKGTDSVTVFREREGENEFRTLGTWRISTNYRHEGNVRWADNDIYAGPVITLGVQTDPGIGAPDFFWFTTIGLSLTQVEIGDDYFTERFNLQMAWGRSPNFAERVLLLPDSTEQRDQIEVPYTNRLYLSTTFQPLAGYYLRGSAEFGEGVPDVARIGIMIQLNVEGLIGSIFGEKEQPKPTP